MSAGTGFDTSPCVDCGVGFEGKERTLVHELTCPLGLAVDEVSAADRDWFAAHPHARERWRPLHWSERDTIRRSTPVELPTGVEMVGRVRVTQLAPGIRVRNYDRIITVLCRPGGAR